MRPGQGAAVQTAWLVTQCVGQLAAARDPELFVDVLQMVLDRSHRDVTVSGDLLVRTAGGGLHGGVELAGGEAGPGRDRLDHRRRRSFATAQELRRPAVRRPPRRGDVRRVAARRRLRRSPRPRRDWRPVARRPRRPHGEPRRLWPPPRWRRRRGPTTNSPSTWAARSSRRAATWRAWPRRARPWSALAAPTRSPTSSPKSAASSSVARAVARSPAAAAAQARAWSSSVLRAGKYRNGEGVERGECRGGLFRPPGHGQRMSGGSIRPWSNARCARAVGRGCRTRWPGGTRSPGGPARGEGRRTIRRRKLSLRPPDDP